jgi:hypothetical protein
LPDLGDVSGVEVVLDPEPPLILEALSFGLRGWVNSSFLRGGGGLGRALPPRGA